MQRKIGIYEKYIKRVFDIVCSFLALVFFSWLYILIAILVRVKLGAPVIFMQPRPGRVNMKTGKEEVFKLYKFRTMTDARDEKGNLLPDEVRLTKFGKILRKTSLDELPEVVNILRGEMSIIGPRPQLVRDMVFMDEQQRMRHTARPGLSGLAQVSGRNAIAWEEKLKIDLEYIKNVSFWNDVKIIIKTVEKAFFKQEGINEENMATAEDFGDYLLRTGRVTQEEYEEKQRMAKNILSN